MSLGQEWGLIAVIGLIVFVIVLVKKTKANKEEERKMGNAITQGEKPLHISLDVSNSSNYQIILNKLGSVVDQVARKCVNRRISTLIMIKKETESTCRITFMMEDINFERFGVLFNSEFKVDDYKASFETSSATGFTTAEEAKKELYLQFNWSDIAVNITDFHITDHGDYAGFPLIVFRFEFMYTGY